MVERGRDHAGGVELHDRSTRSLRTRPRGDDLALDEVECLGDGLEVGVGNDRLRPGIGDRPQDAGGLRDRERHVEPGHRLPAPARVGLLVGAEAGAFGKTPLGEAAQDCINAACQFIAESMEKNEVEASVVALLKEEIVISMGTNYGVEVGHTLIVRKDGEILKDPDSGAILDRLEGEVTGTIEITRVREKTAYCKLIDGTMPVRGDRVVLKAK